MTLFGLSLVALMPAFAQTDKKPDTSAFRMRVLPLPTLYYTPETKIAFGVLNLFLFRTNATARVSTVDFSVVYTQRKQLLIDPTYTIFTWNENYLINGGFVYSKFPDFFFGIGNDRNDEPSVKEFIDYKTIQFNNRVLRKIKKRWFAGLQQQFYQVFDVAFEAGSQYNETNVAGFGGSKALGLGLILLRDNRDNVLSPSRGFYFEFSNLYYRPVLGGDVRFDHYRLDLRKYFALTTRFTLAAQTFANINNGNVPFKQMAQLGGSRLLRGYYTGRFRDNHGWVLQGELRYFIWSRFGVAAFGGIGKVAANLRELEPRDLKGAFGAGIRLKLLRKENFNIRFDAGFGRQSRGFYVSVAEAF